MDKANADKVSYFSVENDIDCKGIDVVELVKHMLQREVLLVIFTKY